MGADPRTKMCKFVSGVSQMVFKEYRTSMIINKMDIAHLTIHAQQIEEEKLKERSREGKRANISDGDFSHSRFYGHGRSNFRQMFSSQGSSSAPDPMLNKYRVYNPKPQ
uniref:Gag-pol protein n=1 Tax=Solanum tuberosum TaxID=4113 RepID=M1DR27_SOLTU